MTTATVGTDRIQVRIRGLVQGVGFRPFVHRLAVGSSLSGYVRNDTEGVLLEVEGVRAAIDRFLADVAAHPPPLARIDAMEVAVLSFRRDERTFKIVDSDPVGAVATYIPPDAAVCDDCVRELFDPDDRRYRYPFITCTNCGPRFTITTSLPYDRPATTMASFRLCEPCQSQYEDPADRRFHAQPLACATCGPQLWVETPEGVVRCSDPAIATAQRILADGGVVAVKGIGGYHLACDATSEVAVRTLRSRKRRADKPFAVMVPDLEQARRLVEVSAEAEAVLTAPARPIVLLPRRAEQLVVDVVAPRNPHLGILLPYAPLHHLLFAPVPQHDAPVPRVLVMTSGNISDEPLCYDDDDARRRLNELADAFLIHDRPIHVPCDDSVVKLVDDRVLPIRRSRGYAPVPISLPVESPPMIAVGGELKNVFCVSRGTDAWLSQHLGDMGSLETLVAFDRSVRQLQLLYDAVPGEVAADRHPAYHTTAWAERAAIGPITTVQHHHAHLASLLAEHGQPIEAAVIGVIFDGTGYGEDGTIWGGEFLVGGYKSVERLAHLASVPLPGGDMTIQRPYRAALAYLHAAGLPWDSDLAPTQACAAGELDVLARQLESGFQCIPSSSMGRLFDVVASLLGVRQTVSFEAQAAIELEELARRGDSGAAQYSLRWNGSTLETGPLLEAIVADVRAGTDTCAIAAGFHRAVVDAAATVVEDIAERRGVRIVGLSGGVFQNAVLLSQLRDRLMDRGLQVLTHSLVPPNDGGLALGQAAVAAARRHRVESTDDRSR